MRLRPDVIAVISIVLLAVAASATSITNGFAFDDVYIIETNKAIHSLARWWELAVGSYWPPERGGDLYRPLTMLSFALQWAAGGGSPLPFHITNIVLYAVVCVAFYRVVVVLLPLPAAWLAAALFAVHPVHVESVGNVVGQAELWAALFMLLALAAFLRARMRGAFSAKDAGVVALFYVLGLLSKEHAIVLPAVLLAAELTVTPRALPFRDRLKAIRPMLLLMVAIALVFYVGRSAVLAQTRGIAPDTTSLFVNQPYRFRAMTMLAVVLEWVRLLIWPAKLSADYSPRYIELVTTPNIDMIAGTLIVVGLIVVAIRARHSAPVLTFGILWLAVSMAIPSNLVIPTGFLLAERTLFVASAAAMLCIGWLATRLVPDFTKLAEVPRRVTLTAIAGVLLMGLVASAMRQPVWRNNETLFTKTVTDVPESYRARMAYAAVLFDRGEKVEAFKQLDIANNLYPEDPALLQYAAAQYALAGKCTVSARLYKRLVDRYPIHLNSRIGLVGCLTVLRDHATARAVARQGLTLGVPQTALRQLIHINDSVETAERMQRAKGGIPAPRIVAPANASRPARAP
jgi:protein O-mannosyl-transferase